MKFKVLWIAGLMLVNGLVSVSEAGMVSYNIDRWGHVLGQAANRYYSVPNTGDHWTLDDAHNTINGYVLNTNLFTVADIVDLTWSNGSSPYAWFTVRTSEASPVPEPASFAMWGLGALGVVFARRKRQQMKLAA